MLALARRGPSGRAMRESEGDFYLGYAGLRSRTRFTERYRDVGPTALWIGLTIRDAPLFFSLPAPKSRGENVG